MPTFNNSGSVSGLIQELSKLGYPLLVIDDGSEIPVESLCSGVSLPKTTILRHDVNLGKGAALRNAFQWARQHGFSHVVTVDADGQHFPSDVSKLAQISLKHPESLILGCRDMDSPLSGHVPGSSKFGRDFSDFWIAIESGKRVRDSQSGLRCYPLANLPDNSCWSVRYDFEVEIMTRWLWRRGAVISQDIAVHYPKNRVSSFRPIVDNTRLTWLHTRLCVLRVLGAGWLFAKCGERQEVAGAGLLDWLMRKIGPGFCYTFLPVMALFYWLVAGHARRSLAAFYRHLGIGGLRANLLAFRNIRAFAYSIVDRVAFACGVVTPQVASERQRFVPSEGGWVILGAHFGDWSFAGSTFAAKHGRRVLIAMNQKISPRLQSIVQKSFANRLGFVDLSAGQVGAVLACKETLEQNGYVCLMADRLPTPDAESLEVTFLGEAIRLPRSVFRLAKAFQRPVKFFNCTRQSFTSAVSYHLVGTTLWDGIENIDEMTLAQRYVETLESVVRQDPQHWFNFHNFWSHEDVKHTATTSNRRSQLPAHA